MGSSTLQSAFDAGRGAVAPFGAEAITGTVVIEGVPRFGEVLTATYEGNAGDSVSYQWYRNGVMPIAGATGPTYQVTKEDIGLQLLVKVKGTDGYTGDLDSGLTAFIQKAAQVPPTRGDGYDIDYATETVHVEEGCVLSDALTGGAVIADGASVTPYLGQTLVICREMTDTHNQSVWVEVSVAPRPAAPGDAVQAVDTAGGGAQDGRVSGITKEMEYKIGDSAWQDGTGDDLTGLSAGTEVVVRVRATRDAPHGFEQVYTVSEGELNPETPEDPGTGDDGKVPEADDGSDASAGSDAKGPSAAGASADASFDGADGNGRAASKGLPRTGDVAGVIAGACGAAGIALMGLAARRRSVR